MIFTPNHDFCQRLSNLVARSSRDPKVSGSILTTDTLKFCDHILFGGSTDTLVYMNLQKSPTLIVIRKFMPKKHSTSIISQTRNELKGQIVSRPNTSFIRCISYGWAVEDLIANLLLGCYQEGSKYVELAG